MSAAPHNVRESNPSVRDEPSAGDGVAWRRRRFSAADVSSHRAIYNLLRTTYPAYSYEEFAERLEEPTYDPADRILLSAGPELVGHAHLVLRYASFGGLRLPIVMIREFAVRCEFDSEEVQAELLARVETAASQRGAVAALLSRRGMVAMPDRRWQMLPRQGYSEADPQEVLAQLEACRRGGQRPYRDARIGLWRRMDLDGLMALYAGRSSAQWGSIVRNEAYWQWLLGRRTHDIILVATAGRPRSRRSNWHPTLTGYAIAKRNHVLEVIPVAGGSGERLLSRLCRDAVDQGDHTLTLHTPADDPLHQTLLSAGGNWRNSSRDGVWPVWCRLLDHQRWVESLFSVWHQCVREQGLTPPCVLSIELPDRRCGMVVSRRSAHWCEENTAEKPADVICDEGTLAALLVGIENWHSASDAGRLILAKPQAAGLLSALFSQRLWHLTLLDWL